MSERLFELEPRLTDRQHFALEAVGRHREGLTALELGALLHERKGVHGNWQRCQWCQKDGLGVLRALRRHDLVRRRRDGQWQRLGRGEDKTTEAHRSSSGDDRPSQEHDPATAAWPDGF